MTELPEVRAYRISQGPNKQVIGKFETLNIQELNAGDTTIEVKYSSINYKDALAATGKGKILRKFPLVGGIDLAGQVIESSSFSKGTNVVVTGCNLSEELDGGYSNLARVNADICVPLPQNLSCWEAMALGTAGFTAALAMQRFLDNGQTPDHGPIVVTGASGGVGSIAIQILHKLGFSPWAITSKANAHSYLKSIGAQKVCSLQELELGDRPLETVKFGGAVDNLGGETLSSLLKHVQLWGNVVSIGLAQGAQFSTTVMPFILRGVSLLGISSNNCPMPLRKKLWQKLASDWKPPKLESIAHRTVALSQIESEFSAFIEGKVQGRVVVDCQK